MGTGIRPKPMQRVVAALSGLHAIPLGVACSTLSTFLTTASAQGWDAAALTLPPELAGPIVALMSVTGLARLIKGRQGRSKAEKLAGQLNQIARDTGTAADLLRDIADGTITLEVDFDELAKQDLADAVAIAVRGEIRRLRTPVIDNFEDALRSLNLATRDDIQRMLDEQVQRLAETLGQSPASTLTTNFHHVGIDRDEKFVAVEDGRERNLRDLHAALSDGHASITHSLSGAGGVGKTALAVEYAYRHAIHGPDYEACWWLNASAETIEPRAFELAELLGARLAPDAEPAMVRQAIRKALTDGRHHLLILDNLEDAAQAETLMPPSPSRLLITTRLKQAPGRVIDIGVLAEEESLRLLRKARGPFEDGSFDPDLRAIAEHLGRHALALRYAATYLAAYGDQSPHEVLEALRTADVGDEAHLFEDVEPSEVDRRYGRSVAESLTLHFSRFGSDALEMRLLQFAAFCHPDAIPVELFVELAGEQERAVRKALKALADLHIVEYEETIGLHRLTQSAVRARMTADEKTERLNVLCEHLRPRFADWKDHTKWAEMDRWIGHGLAMVEHTAQHCRTPQAARLADSAGRFLHRGARYAEAIKAHQLAYDIGKASPEQVGPDLPGYANNLGYLLWTTGTLDTALALFREAKQIVRMTVGDADPKVAVALSNEGNVLLAKGEVDAALKCFVGAEEIDRAAFGDEHPNVAICLGNIGKALHDKGDLRGAFKCHREAERIDRIAFGDDHPEVATDINSIGSILSDKGHFDCALRCYREAERIDRAAFGDDHPKVAIRVNNIGSVLLKRGDSKGALSYYREAERMARAAFGNDHPEVANYINNIGTVLHARGDREGAWRMTAEALRIDIRMLGPRSRDTLKVARNHADVGGDPIALAREAAGDEAAEALRQALEEPGG